MSLSLQLKSLFFFFFIVFLFPSLSTSISKPPRLQFPCQSSSHLSSYPFCNTSLSIPKRAHFLISLLTLDEKIQQLSDHASAIPRLGVPAYEWWSESLHGIASNGPGVNFNQTIKSATSFPQVIVSTAAFNKTLWSKIASAIAVEARAMYNYGQAGLTFWAPVVNIFRDPRWGRGQETPGEDPLVASSYAVEFVRSFQALGMGVDTSGIGEKKRVMIGDEDDDGGGSLVLSACCKHLIAYDLEKWGNFSRYGFNAVVR